MKRDLAQHIFEDLKEKMVFLGGPRQVGKTTLAKQMSQEFFDPFEYLNWDIPGDQKRILDFSFSPSSKLLLFDEIHKYKNWKNLIKGLYDGFGDQYRVLVTGSARLDLYRKGGDSMLGRYHYHRLHPISYAEAAGYSDQFSAVHFETKGELIFCESKPQILQDLMEFGGFPEPFLKKNKRTLRRWQNERKIRLIREDIRDAESIRELSLLQVLTNILPERVGTIFSLNSLREDLKVAHRTLSKWIEILENFYYCYRIYPYNSSRIKSLKKEPKLYLWDYSEVPDEAERFENLIASHLLKFVHHLYDTYGLRLDLCYLRDIDQREVDFLITLENRPLIAVEVKWKNQRISTPLKYFRAKLNIPYSYQVLREDGIDLFKHKEGVHLISADRFLTGLV